MHVVRLRSIGQLESQGLLVPGQGSTLHIWGFFAEDGEESSVVILGSAKRRPKWQSLDRLHLCQHMVSCRCRGLLQCVV